ncbi:hypothetical protein MSPP1_000127 [Malassezia sp. CBS 17886]|nr:hypothetical protein MSPP1_000127 [Malassezia sp. CBS 17886]
MPPAPLVLHARCRVANLGSGEILFVGQTSFATGLWVGLVLDEPLGKNDGSVQGKRYFVCDPCHGVFVRPSQVHGVDDAPGTAPAGPAPAVPASGGTAAAAPAPRLHTQPRSAPSQALAGASSRARVAQSAAPPRVRAPASGRGDTESPSAARLLRAHPPDASERRVGARAGATRPASASRAQVERRAAFASRVPEDARAAFASAARPSDARSPTGLEAQHSETCAELARQRDAAAQHACALEEARNAGKSDVAAIQASCDELQTRIDELTEGLEMVTLDREMAEEKSEALQQELESTNERAESLALELQVLQEQQHADADARLTDLPADQAELMRQNERLKEALTRLRDAAQATELAQRREIASLRTASAEREELQATHDGTVDALAKARALIDELRAQAEVAQGAEELLEQLTEQNGALEERVARLAAEVQELEALQAVSDELEETHRDTEAQLQRDLDAQEDTIVQLRQDSASRDAHLTDYDATLDKFRALVATLAQERDTARAEAAVRGGAQPPRAAAPAAPAVDAVVGRAHLRAIPAALEQLAALQAHRRLHIVRAYLAPGFWDADEPAVASVLFYERLGALSDLLKHTLELDADVQEHLLQRTLDESMVATCALRHALAHVSALTKQIGAVLVSGPPGVFLAHAHDHDELAPVEQQLRAMLDALRDGRFAEADGARACEHIVAQLEAVSATLLEYESAADLAAKEIGSAVLAGHDTDTILVAMALALQESEHLCDGQERAWMAAPLAQIVACLRSARVSVRKMVRRLSSLEASSEMIDVAAIPDLPGLGRLSSELVAMATRLAHAVAQYAHQARASGAPVDSHSLDACLVDAVDDAVGAAAASPDACMARLQEQTHAFAHILDGLLASTADQGSVVKVVVDEPWAERARVLHASMQQSEQLDHAVDALRAERAALLQQLRQRDDALDAHTLKTARLKHQLDRAYAEATEATDLRAQVAALQAQLGAGEPRDAGAASSDTPDAEEDAHVPVVLQHELVHLRRALRAVRMENMQLKGRALLEDVAGLAPLAAPSAAPPARRTERGADDRRHAQQELALLRRQLGALAAAPRVVDVSGEGAPARRAAWRPSRHTASGQLAMRLLDREHMQVRVSQLEQQLC